MEYVVLLILFGIAIQCGAETELPDYITPCKASDEKCLKKTIHALKPHFEIGISEFQLPPIANLQLPDFNQSKNIPPDMVYDAILTDVKFGEVNKFKISKISVDLDSLIFHLVINFPLLAASMNDKGSGHALGLDLNWDGILRFKLKNVTIDFSLDGSYVLKEGIQYVTWKEGNIGVSSGLINYDLEDLFKNKELLNVFLKTIEGNREIVDSESRLFVKVSLAKYILRVINIAHDLYPVDILYTGQ